MNIKTIKANNNEIDYFCFGNGDRNMVIIPGLSLKSVMLSSDAIAYAYSIFNDEYKVFVFDRAKNISNGCTIKNMADDIAVAMKELCIDSAYIFGASQGGMIAQLLAQDYPELVSKMVIGSSASRVNDESAELIKKWISYARKRDAVALNHSIFTSLYSQELLDSIGDALATMKQDGTDEEMERFVHLAGACIGFDNYDNLVKIKCPVLTIGAKNDKVLGGNASIEMAEKLNQELFMYNGNHAIYDEAPDYKQRIYNFFK